MTDNLLKIFLFVFFLFGNRIGFSQNDFLKSDKSIYTDSTLKIPKIKTVWSGFVIENSVPIRSLTDTSDFSDLEFLKEIFKDKRFVWLGESSHFTKEYNQIRSRMIQYLHQEMGFNVLAFESNIWDCYQANISDLKPQNILYQSIYGVWNTTTLQSLMQYVMNRQMILSGIDMKTSAMQPNYYFETVEMPKYDSLLSKQLHESNQKYFELYASIISKEHKQLSGEETHQLKSLLSEWSMLIERIDKMIQKKPNDITLKIYHKEMIYKKEILFHLINNQYYTFLNKRDSLMAENLIWLSEEIFPNEKFIIWAHNGHASKSNYLKDKRLSIGQYLPDSIIKQSYFCGLYAYGGTMFSFNDNTFSVKKPSKNSIENILMQPRFRYSFFDLSGLTESTDNSWAFKKMDILYWGALRLKINISKVFDGIILIDNVSLPNHHFIDFEQNGELLKN